MTKPKQLPGSNDATIHRPLPLVSPMVRGKDVAVLQHNVNQRFEHLKIELAIKPDGQLGPRSFNAIHDCALAMGAIAKDADRIEEHVINQHVQQLIRGRKPTAAESANFKKRADYRKQLRKANAMAAGERAIKLSAGLVGVHEIPDGSNWGGKVEQMIKFTGYNEAVYWCGCAACWIVVKIGKANVPVRIRMGFAGYIEQDAHNNANGFRGFDPHAGRAGDVASLWGNEHVVTLREDVSPGDTMIKTREGNTSASTSSGSQFNGGQVADHERSISDIDGDVVARPAWA